MSDTKPKIRNLERVDEARFTAEIDRLMQVAEKTRLGFMQAHRKRDLMVTVAGLAAVVLGGAAFGWFFLIKANLMVAFATLVPSMALPLLLQGWARAPLQAYSRDYKQNFMPKFARVLGGFKFHPSRGLSEKYVAKTRLFPHYDMYHAEDCFIGIYKGVKITFSEGELQSKKGKDPVFKGIFCVLETKNKFFDGHTIITSDEGLFRLQANTAWQKLQPVKPETNSIRLEHFKILSNRPETAKLLAGEKLLTELDEAAEIFAGAPASMVFFGGKYVFLAIPYHIDMFEPSNIYVPVTTKTHAMTCRKEIEQLMEIVDIFEIYKADKN